MYIVYITPEKCEVIYVKPPENCEGYPRKIWPKSVKTKSVRAKSARSDCMPILLGDDLVTVSKLEGYKRS